jgi:hypothetical protein
MTEATSSPIEEPLLDQMLREAVPEIKLALGDLIDRDNSRAIPDRYARLLPETMLVVTLRPDAADALQPVAAELEKELTGSCMRHGSLYDRDYRVKLRAAADVGAPLFKVAKEQVKAGEPEPEPAQHTPLPASPVATEATIAAPRPAPAVDPDATRATGAAPTRPAPGWMPGRWELVVDDAEGGVAEQFPLVTPHFTVGRQTENPELRSDVALEGAPSVSRRQLAVRWDPKDGAPGFLICNLGLNALHLEDGEIPGANLKGPFRLEEVDQVHCRRVAPDAAIRIGEHGPVVRIRQAALADVPEDPDATRYG